VQLPVVTVECPVQELLLPGSVEQQQPLLKLDLGGVELPQTAESSQPLVHCRSSSADELAARGEVGAKPGGSWGAGLWCRATPTVTRAMLARSCTVGYLSEDDQADTGCGGRQDRVHRERGAREPGHRELVGDVGDDRGAQSDADAPQQPVRVHKVGAAPVMPNRVATIMAAPSWSMPLIELPARPVVPSGAVLAIRWPGMT